VNAILSGPMFEASTSALFKSLCGRHGAHYNVFECVHGMGALRHVFPDGEANDLNFCLFSTSGVHGSYTTIEKAEKAFNKKTREEWEFEVTFLIVHPRLVCLRYGNCTPQSAEDFAYIKKLRESSLKAVAKIGEMPRAKRRSTKS
jgi:hypothetical protein